MARLTQRFSGAAAIFSFGATTWACGESLAPDANPGDALPWASATREDVIEDCENNDHRVALLRGRTGYIYTFSDEHGTKVTPTRGADGGVFAMTEGGANGSLYRARFHGRTAAGAGTVFAGLGMNFLDPKGPYSAAEYCGIEFWAKRGKGSASAIRLKVPDAFTDPDGKKCNECFNDFGTDLELAENWAHFRISFERMAQMPGWGAPRPPSIDRTTLYGIQWQVGVPGAEFDISVDDVMFSRCKK